MPHTRSAKKRMKQSAKRRLRNRAALRDIKTQIKKVEQAAEAGDLAALQTEARAAFKKLDKAGQRRVVHPNTASRKKSQIALLVRSKESGGK